MSGGVPDRHPADPPARTVPEVGTELWRPTAERAAASRLQRFAERAGARHGLGLGVPADYDALRRWSVAHPEAFWRELAAWTGALPEDCGPVLADAAMPGARWFPEARINYAEQVFARAGADDDTAVVHLDEDGTSTELGWGELRERVAAFAATLRGLGVGPGDRVAGYLPNTPEAVVAFLGTVSIGAVWTVCAPEFGAQAALARLWQTTPSVLVAVDGYRFGGRVHDRRATVAELRAGLESLTATVVVPRTYGEAPADTLAWDDAVTVGAAPEYPALPFDHPLWIVYSSGTTGAPKGIVHGHGGVVLEHLKQMLLHNDVGPGDRFSWYASTSWIMWNIAVSALLAGATVVLYDGAPNRPDVDAQFALAARARLTYLGTSAGYLMACERARAEPGRRHDLSALRTIGVTGSPLPPSTYGWVYDAVGSDLAVVSSSGGTDVASGFLGGAPLLPVTAGQLARPMLGVAAQAWDDDGRPVVGRPGELVVTAPMPSMPIGFWGDDGGERYRASYFDRWPGIWRHGDLVQFDEHGAAVILGRSDSTLNRGGVRIGTAEIYSAVDEIEAVTDSLALGIEQADGGYWMPLFVVLAPGAALTAELTGEINAVIRRRATPRHVPDEVIAVPGVPRTRTGKKLEVPLKRIFQGLEPDRAATASAVDRPELVEHFRELARHRTG